jgi:hypothetical protein
MSLTEKYIWCILICIRGMIMIIMTWAKIRAGLEQMILIDILRPGIYRKFEALVRIFKEIWR